MDEQKRQPKISLPEAIFIGLFIAFLDILDLIPVVGDITDIIAAPVMLYLFMKGVNGTLFLISEVLDLIPGIQEFPTRSIAWWTTVGIDHFAPAKVAELTQKAGQALEGEGEMAGAAGSAATATEGGAATGAIEGASGAAANGMETTESATEMPRGGTERGGGVSDAGGSDGGAQEEEKEMKNEELNRKMEAEPERNPEDVTRERLLGNEPLTEEDADGEEEGEEEEEEELPMAA